MVAMNSRSVVTKPTGSSWWGKWPERSKSRSRLPGMSSWARMPWRAGMIGSLSPRMINVGTAVIDMVSGY